MSLRHSLPIYIIVDIETDGPIPGLHSILSIGAVAITKEKIIGEFYATLLPLTNATTDPRTMEWWVTEPAAWKEATANQEDPKKVIEQFYAWIISITKNPIFVSQPTAFDYPFINWYLYNFVDKNPFTDSTEGAQTLDLKSYLAGALRKDSKNLMNNLPKELIENTPTHSHNALDDAMGYALILQKTLQNYD